MGRRKIHTLLALAVLGSTVAPALPLSADSSGPEPDFPMPLGPPPEPVVSPYYELCRPGGYRLAWHRSVIDDALYACGVHGNSAPGGPARNSCAGLYWVVRLVDSPFCALMDLRLEVGTTGINVPLTLDWYPLEGVSLAVGVDLLRWWVVSRAEFWP